MRDLRNPVPGLPRDPASQSALHCFGEGPGSSPGRGSPGINLAAPDFGYAALCLYHGLASLRCNLHRSHRKPGRAGRGASCRAVGPYREVQDQDLGLVRNARGIRHEPATRTRNQALAARLEDCVDRRAQSALAGCDGADSDMIQPCSRLDPEPLSCRYALGRERSRVKPGTDRAFAAGTDVLFHAVLEVAGVVG